MIQSISFHGVALHIYRDDKNHDIVSGNKLHKLEPNLRSAVVAQCTSVLSFGGPYSNHLHALAFACKQRGLRSIGVVRGELQESLTPCLKDCKDWGMQLLALPRRDYRALQEQMRFDDFGQLLNPDLLASHFHVPQGYWIIPEGGSNQAAVRSLQRVYQDIFLTPGMQSLTHAVCASGTGATVAGLALAAPPQVQVLGVQAVAEGEATITRISQWLPSSHANLHIVPGHLGGFGKIPTALKQFMQDFERQYGILLDPVYTAKVMFYLQQAILDKTLSADCELLMIHTGGLQGRR